MAAGTARRARIDAGRLIAAREAQRAWAALPVCERLGVVRRARHEIALAASDLAAEIERPEGDTLIAEVLPLCEACRFLEREADDILAPRALGRRGRPLWLSGVATTIFREPHGVVLIIGPGNYPLLLPAVHTLQALVAGNAVVLKPGRGGASVCSLFGIALRAAGLDERLLTVTGDDPEEAHDALAHGVDKVVLTGSFETGRALLRELAETATPSVMELSGDDSVFVLDDADVDLVARALGFGTRLNGGNTCIAPKRVYCAETLAGSLERRITGELPVIRVQNENDALSLAAHSPYALGAAVFGSEKRARALAARIRAGVVVINDVIVPTADPRLPFGGRGRSGFGVTRGAEGLLEMTTVKAVAARGGRWRPHYEEPKPGDARLFADYIKAAHAFRWRDRLAALTDLIRTAGRRG